MSSYTANSFLFLLHTIDHMNFTSGKRLHIKCAAARNCGFLVHPSDSESRSQSQHCRVLVIWNCILLLVAEKVALSVPLKTLYVTIIALGKQLSESKSIQLFMGSCYGSCSTGMRILSFNKRKSPHTVFPNFSQ